MTTVASVAPEASEEASSAEVAWHPEPQLVEFEASFFGVWVKVKVAKDGGCFVDDYEEDESDTIFLGESGL